MTAYINSQAVQLTRVTPALQKKISVQSPPGSNQDSIDSFGSGGLELEIECLADSLSEKYTVLAEFLADGIHTFKPGDGYQHSITAARASSGRDYQRETDAYIPFAIQCRAVDPYRHSTTLTERSKTISTNGQTWSADDSSNNISTAGTVDVIPSIAVTAGAMGTSWTREGVDYTDLDETEFSHNVNSTDYQLASTLTLNPAVGRKWHISNTSMQCKKQTGSYNAYGKVTIQAASLYSGVETSIQTFTIPADSTTYVTYSQAQDVTSAENETVTIRFYTTTNGHTIDVYSQNHETQYESIHQNILAGVQVLNTADTTLVCDVCNEIMPGGVVTITKEGTGTLEYSDGFTDQTYQDVAVDYSGLSYDAVNDRLTLAAVGGYIVYKIDTKYPVTGIPTLALNVQSGAVQLAIADYTSAGIGTWYEVDDQSATVLSAESVTHLLDNKTNLRLKGKTAFFLKIYTDGANALVLNSIDLNCDIVTIDAQLPKVNTGGVNTFQADQDSDSSLNATVKLSYRDAHWGI